MKVFMKRSAWRGFRSHMGIVKLKKKPPFPYDSAFAFLFEPGEYYPRIHFLVHYDRVIPNLVHIDMHIDKVMHQSENSKLMPILEFGEMMNKFDETHSQLIKLRLKGYNENNTERKNTVEEKQ